MRLGLFLKIFTSLWFTVVIAGMLLEATAWYARRSARVQDPAIPGALVAAARTAVDTLEREGPRGLSGYLVGLQRTRPLMAYLLGGKGNEVTGRRVPPAARREGVLALLEPGIHQGGAYG